MARQKLSRGKCAFCGVEMAKSGVGKHLAACARYKEAVSKAEMKTGKEMTLYHLRVQAAGRPSFWLDLEMSGSAKLKDLDLYLRAIWLECCGHLSRFSQGGWRDQQDIGMGRQLSAALKTGETLTHEYDFGTTSETVIKAIGVREGKRLTARPITLLVRNVQPEEVCIECGRPAGWLCEECIIEDQVWGILCEEHAKTHPHEDYGEPVAMVNSPRMGLCGYAGPADPPY